MTERLLLMGKRILEHSHRLALLPQQPGLPPAYATLLLDPADLLASAWGTLFSTTDSPETSEVMPLVERHSVHSLAEQSPLNNINSDITSASRVTDSPAASIPDQRKAVRLQPIQPPPGPAQPKWTVKSHWPLSLVSRTSKQVTYGTQPRTTFDERIKFDERTKSDFQMQPDASLTTRASSDMPPDSPLPPPTNLPRVESSSPILRAVDLSPALALPVTTVQTRAAVSPEEMLSSHEASLTPPVSTTRIITKRQEEGMQQEDAYRAEAQLKAAQFPVINFSPNPSSLASVLNANLISDRDAMAHTARLETPGLTQRADALPNSLQLHDRSHDGSSLDARDASSLRSSEARDRLEGDYRPEDDHSMRGHDAPRVEDLLEELYERLRLEFLRTYGTSGE